jgi:hypothetical protein
MMGATVLAPAYGKSSALMVLDLPAATSVPDHPGIVATEERGDTLRVSLRYTYPGGPEEALYLAVPSRSLQDGDFAPTGAYHGAYRWGSVEAIPGHTLCPGRIFSVVEPEPEVEEPEVEEPERKKPGSRRRRR